MHTILVQLFSSDDVRYLDGVFLVDLRLDFEIETGIALFWAEGGYLALNGVFFSISSPAISFSTHLLLQSCILVFSTMKFLLGVFREMAPNPSQKESEISGFNLTDFLLAGVHGLVVLTFVLVVSSRESEDISVPEELDLGFDWSLSEESVLVCKAGKALMSSVTLLWFLHPSAG